MRSIACALGGIVLLTCCSPSIRAEESTGSRWWPFGQKKVAVAPPPPEQAPPSAALNTPPGGALTTPVPPAQQSPAPAVAPPTPNDENWMLKSSKSKVSWPRLAKPNAPTNPFAKKEAAAEPPRNTWVEPTPEPPKPSPFKPITDGASKVARGTKNAWRKTVDAVTPGEPTPPPRNSSSSRVARDDAKPSFWQRMFGPDEEPQGSQTMPGFIAQQRVDAAPNRTR